MDLTIISVIFGGLLILAVIFKYLQKDGITNITLSCFFTLFGFALLASPAWNSISFKSSNTELRLIKEATKQMDNYVRILDQYDTLASQNANWQRPTQMTSNHIGKKNKTPNRKEAPKDFKALSESLRQQKERIETALAQGNLDLAIAETQSSTHLIESIANNITQK